MSFSFLGLAEQIRAGSEITAADVLSARRSAWSDGVVSPAEAEALFEINRICGAPPPEWCDFFVEAITNYVVHQQQPRDHVDDDKARWLIERLASDGRLESFTEIELLAKVLEASFSAPEALKTFAIAEIERAVLTGEGPTRHGGDIRPGVIDEAEVTLLRRIIFSGGGEGSVSVSRDEAEMLWRLKDATAGAANAPGWERLFVQGVGNHLMAWSGRGRIDRSEAARLEAFVADRRSSVGSFLSRMLSASPADGFAEISKAADRQADHDEQVSAARGITGAEADWLTTQVGADVDPLEQALIAFIRRESGWSPAGH
jgi:hypothetical protein